VVPLKARSASAPARSIRATIVWGGWVGSSRSRSRSWARDCRLVLSREAIPQAVAMMPAATRTAAMKAITVSPLSASQAGEDLCPVDRRGTCRLPERCHVPALAPLGGS